MGFGFNLVAVRGAENALVGAGAEQINLNAHIGDFSALTVGTIEFWFRARAGSMERAILSAADKTDANSSLVVFFDASPNDGELTFLIWEAGVGSLKFASGTTTLNDGSWHRASITMDVSGSTLYIDNADDSPVYSIGTASTQKWFNSVNDLDVMAALFLDASSPLYWADNLEVDDLLIYNRALTDVERTENYNAELAAHS